MSVITIAQKDIHEFHAVIASGGAPAAFAAAELDKYVKAITGSPLAADGDNAIVLSVDDGIPEESWRVKIDEKQMAISAGSGRGLIYGVYELLEKLGVRFYQPDLETLGEGGDLPIGEFGNDEAFEYRHSDWQCGRDKVWELKQHHNAEEQTDDVGSYIKWAGFVHTMHAITGVPQDKQPCLSDPEVLAKAKAYVRAILEKDPTTKIISVSQNDNTNYCKCPKCAAVDAEEGSHMGTLLRFVNAVADDIREDYPDVAIETLAYQYTRNTPSITRPRDNVIIRLCSIECCFSHPLADETCEQNAHFKKDIEDWNKISNRLYIWDYITDFSFYIPPFPNFGVIRDNMRFFASHGVRGMYPEGNYNSPASGEFGELRCYLMSLLMRNPYMTEVEYQKEMDGFLAAYYGSGWRYIRAFLDFTVREAAYEHMTIWKNPRSAIRTDMWEAMYDTIENWWNKAEEMAGDRLPYVKRSRLQWTYISLILKPDAEKGRQYYYDVQNAGIRWNEWREFGPDQDFSKAPDEWK